MRDPEFDLEAAVSQMAETHLHCRDYGHGWRPHTARYLPNERAYEQTLRCTRCRTMRSRLLDSHGLVVSTHYTYPDHYLVKGMGYLAGEDRGLIRLASIEADLKHGRKTD